MTDHPNLAAALAAVQSQLPHIGKDNKAEVKNDQGKRLYSYAYADLPGVSRLVLPLLAAHGLSFSAKPTLHEGKFVLEYTLRHASGDADTGYYPLTQQGTPQQQGSAITYARRYALCAVTGIAPDEDDDGQAAELAHRQAEQQRQQAAQQAREALEELAATCTAMGLDRGLVAGVYATENRGADIRKATAAQIRAFIEHLDEVDPTRIKVPAGNGAAS